MSVIYSRLLSRNVRNGLAVSIRMCSEEHKDILQIVREAEKNQIFERAVGKNDPFKMKALKRKASTKSSPNLIPSYYDCRIIGCVCEEDSNSIVWMWLFKGEAKKCDCGHWFKLVEYNAHLK